jgi:hypothetical protein
MAFTYPTAWEQLIGLKTINGQSKPTPCFARRCNRGASVSTRPCRPLAIARRVSTSARRADDRRQLTEKPVDPSHPAGFAIERDGVESFEALPAPATLGVRKATAITQGATVCTLTGRSARTIAANATAAGVVRSIGYAERGVTVAPATGIEVLVRVGMGKWRKIAQG